MLRLRCSDIWKPGQWKYSAFLSPSFFLSIVYSVLYSLFNDVCRIVYNLLVCYFRLTLPQFNSKLFDVFSIQNDTPYLRMRKKMGKWNWSTKDPVIRSFFLFLLNWLFIYSNIYVFIYLFITQQLWMSALAGKTISITCHGTI